jgi:site-specific DNA-methyltransferase (adenine-specific)
MSVYFQTDTVTLYHGDSFEVMAGMADESVDCVITDPPYTGYVHKNSKSNRSGNGISEIDFDSFTDEKLILAFEELGRLTKRWVVSTLDHRHALPMENNPPKGLRLMRIGVWVKNNPMPQISADRPGHGWESIAYLHKEDVKSEWNGGGSHGNYVSNLATPTGHPTPKPVKMFSSFVERFSNPNDLIFDPFAGGGTTLVAAHNMGRRAIGVELDEKYCEIIAKRLSQQSFDLENL